MRRGVSSTHGLSPRRPLHQSAQQWPSEKENRAGGIRTHDLCVPNAALYQAEPQPDVNKDLLHGGGLVASGDDANLGGWRGNKRVGLVEGGIFAGNWRAPDATE
jgi:hypothetical protein